MGTRGPVPLRSEQKIGHGNGSAYEPDKVAASEFDRFEHIDMRPEQPPADPKWHQVALDYWEALGKSPESIWMSPAGWAVARLQAEQISRELKPQPIGVHPETGEAVMASIPMKGASFSAHMKAFAAFGLTEGDRRRMGVELSFHKEEQADLALADVVSIDTGRAAALGG